MEGNQFSVDIHSSVLNSFFARNIGSTLSKVGPDQLFLKNSDLLKAIFCE